MRDRLEALGDERRHVACSSPRSGRGCRSRRTCGRRRRRRSARRAAPRSRRGRAGRRRSSRRRAASSRSRTAGSLKRATPMTRRAGVARFARRASVGPILPATPRIIRSPSTVASSSTSAWLGSVRKSSSASLDAKRSWQGRRVENGHVMVTEGGVSLAACCGGRVARSRLRSRGGSRQESVKRRPSKRRALLLSG